MNLHFRLIFQKKSEKIFCVIYTHMRESANVNNFLYAPGAQRRTHMRASANDNNFLYAPGAQRRIGNEFAFSAKFSEKK